MHRAVYVAAAAAGIVLAAACAKVASPTGGPKDERPPIVVATSPPDSSVQVDTDSDVFLEFSESMNRQTVEQNLFITPYPDPYPYFRWDRMDRRVRIEFVDPMEIERTYIFTLGSGAADAHGVKQANSHSFAFSTGASLDSGSVSGTVWERKSGGYVPAVGATVGLYPLDSRSADPDPSKHYAEYQTQAGDTGGFTFGYLAPGRYRVLAWRDQNGNSLHGPDESLGVPPADIELATDRNEARVSPILIAPYDAIAPDLYVIRATDERHVEVRFSEPVMAESVHISTPNDTGFSLEVLPTFGARTDHVVYTDPQRSATSYGVTIRVSDLAGLESVFGADTTIFDSDSSPDVTPPALVTTEVPVPLIGNELRAATFWFDDVLDPMVTDSLVMLRRDSTVVSGTWEVTPPNRLTFRPADPLPDGPVRWLLPLTHVRDTGGNAGADTVGVSIAHVPADSLGEIAGTVADSIRGDTGPIWIEARPLAGEWKRAEVVDTLGTFRFGGLPAGGYRFFVWCDADSSSTWNPGTATPFQPSERWAVSDTVHVRARWTTSGVEIGVE